MATEILRRLEEKAMTKDGAGVDTQPDYDLFVAAHRIADMAYEYARAEAGGGDPNTPYLGDNRNSNANPFYGQSETGLFFVLYYGQPGHILTPWGNYNCWSGGSGSWEGRMDKFLARLGATLHEAKKVSQMGEFGPVYAIHGVDGALLPEPTMRPREEYLSYEESKVAWSEMEARYRSENN